MTEQKQTNREFMTTDTNFMKCCGIAKVSPTIRQASKFRNKKGGAYDQLGALKQLQKASEAEKAAK